MNKPDVIAAAEPSLECRVGHQPIHDSGRCLGKCPYLDVWRHPFWHHTAWCWKQMRDLVYYDGLIADCLHRTPDENLTRLAPEMMPNAEITGRTLAQNEADGA
ncbi:MAG: hypothetical protein ACYCZR_02250 [Burkholderiales bacterium]